MLNSTKLEIIESVLEDLVGKLGVVSVVVGLFLGVSSHASQNVFVKFNGQDFDRIIASEDASKTQKEKAKEKLNALKEQFSPETCLAQAFDMAKVINMSGVYKGNLEVRALAVEAKVKPNPNRSKVIETMIDIDTKDQEIEMSVYTIRPDEGIVPIASSKVQAEVTKNTEGNVVLDCKALEASDLLFENATKRLQEEYGYGR